MTTYNTNLSFASILARVATAEQQVAQAVSHVGAVASSATAKTVQAVKTTASVVGGVLPVTNNALDVRTEKLLAIIEEQGMQIDSLYATIGLPKPQVAATDISTLVAMRLQAIKAGIKEEEAQPAVVPASVAVAPTVDQAAILKQLGVNVAQTVSAPVVAPTPVVAPVATLNTPPLQAPLSVVPEAPQTWVPAPSMNLTISKPSNWHHQ